MHRAAKWYVILQKLEERGHSFDLRFSTEIEEFQKLLLFALSLDSLVQSNIMSLNNSKIRGALLDPFRFESFTYEALIAANYASNGFNVQLPDLLGTGRIDVYARKGSVEVYAECKKLRRSERYIELAVKAMRKLSRQRFCGIVDLLIRRVLSKVKDAEKIVELIGNAVASSRGEVSNEYAAAKIQKLPEIIENIYEISLPQPENIEFLVSSSYMGIFNGVFKVREPKVMVIRDPCKHERLKKQLLNRLEEAGEQLKSVDAGHGIRKIIYIDISEVAGKPTLQLPEVIKITVGPEILGSHLEQVCKEWLSRHPEIDAIGLTQTKLYLDQFGFPFAIAVENKPVLAFTAPGWTVETMIVPVPHNAPPEALVNLGAQMVEKGNYRLAELYYKMAINFRPHLKEAWNNLGRLYTEFLGRPDIGLKYLEKCLELDLNHASALINKAIALAKLGRYDEALGELDKALKLDPSNYKAWYNKALIHFMLGQYNEAYKYCSKALELKHDYPLANNLMEGLKRNSPKSIRML